MAKVFHTTRTENGYELTIIAYSETLDCMVSIPAGEYATIEDIVEAYPELLAE
jgi:hypothetical protein